MIRTSNPVQEDCGFPPGPYACMPGTQGNAGVYEIYCCTTGEALHAVTYLESAHIAESDAYFLTFALNVYLHGADPGKLINDRRRMGAYEEFRGYFPGPFETRNASIGRYYAFEVYCAESQNVFCKITMEGQQRVAFHQADCFCRALNRLTNRVDARMGSLNSDLSRT